MRLQEKDLLEATLSSTEVTEKIWWAQAITHVTKEDHSPTGPVCWGWVRETQVPLFLFQKLMVTSMILSLLWMVFGWQDQEHAFAHGEAEAGSAQMSAGHGGTVAMPAWGKTAEVPLCSFSALFWPNATLCMCAHLQGLRQVEGLCVMLCCTQKPQPWMPFLSAGWISERNLHP